MPDEPEPKDKEKPKPEKPHFVLEVQDSAIGQETVIKPQPKDKQNG